MSTQEHVPRYVASRGHDQYTCSCGWEGQTYCNDVNAAYDEWLVHAHYNNVPVKKRDELRQARAVEMDRRYWERRNKR